MLNSMKVKPIYGQEEFIKARENGTLVLWNNPKFAIIPEMANCLNYPNGIKFFSSDTAREYHYAGDSLINNENMMCYDVQVLKLLDIIRSKVDPKDMSVIIRISWNDVEKRWYYSTEDDVFDNWELYNNYLTENGLSIEELVKPLFKSITEVTVVQDFTED